MNEKIAIFAFNGEMMCFYHAMLNTLDLFERGNEVVLILEGKATKLIEELDKEICPFNKTYKRLKEEKLIEMVCKACAAKMGTLEEAKKQGFMLGEDMFGHPSIAQYLIRGYRIITM